MLTLYLAKERIMVKCINTVQTDGGQEKPCEAMFRALKTIMLDPRHRVWLTENDPNALAQIEYALDFAEGKV